MFFIVFLLQVNDMITAFKYDILLIIDNCRWFVSYVVNLYHLHKSFSMEWYEKIITYEVETGDDTICHLF